MSLPSGHSSNLHGHLSFLRRSTMNPRPSSPHWCPLFNATMADRTHGPLVKVTNLQQDISWPRRRRLIKAVVPLSPLWKSPFRPMLNILARMIFQLIPVASPDHFASGDVNTLLTILQAAPIDGDLIRINQDLAGFFTSIDQARFIGAWYMLLDFLRPHMNVGGNDVFSVYPGKSNNPGDLIKGRAFRRLNVTRKVVIKDVPSLLTTALENANVCVGQPLCSPTTR